MSATDSVIGSANSSEDSVVIVEETVRTNRPPARICAAQAGLSYDEVRTMRPYLGDTIMNSRQFRGPVPHISCASYPFTQLGEHVHQLHITCHEYPHHLVRPRDPRHNAWKFAAVFKYTDGVLWMRMSLQCLRHQDPGGY